MNIGHRSYHQNNIFAVIDKEHLVTSNHNFSLTFAKIPAEIARNGLTDRMTRVNFQPFQNPIINPAKNEENHWNKVPTLSPIPS